MELQAWQLAPGGAEGIVERQRFTHPAEEGCWSSPASRALRDWPTGSILCVVYLGSASGIAPGSLPAPYSSADGQRADFTCPLQWLSQPQQFVAPSTAKAK